MNWAEIAYLDVAVADFVRDHILEGDAVFIVERSTLTVRWTNGVGSKWLDLGGLGAVVDPDVLLVKGPGARQLTSALSRPLTSKRIAAARTNGILPALTQMHLYPFNFGGKRNDDLAVIAFSPAELASTGDKLRNALNGLDEDETSAAIVGPGGQVIEAFKSFDESKLDAQKRAELCAICATEADRMVKRIVTTPNGQFAVGVGRLSDDPDRYLFLLMPSASAASSLDRTDEANNAPDGSKSEDPPTIGDHAEVDAPNAIYALGEQQDEATNQQEKTGAASMEGWSPAQLGSTPIRFVWKTDRDGVIVDMSKEFASAVGPKAANVIGKKLVLVAKE
ncbi:MAG: hypothetical protein AAFR27_11915, partial [Pseudomonadota bacterium]